MSKEKTFNEIVKINTNNGEMEAIITLSEKELDGISMTPDGKRLIYAAVEKQSDVWLMENFDSENEIEQPFGIVNSSELRQLTYLHDGLELIRQKKYAEAEKVYREGFKLNEKNLRLIFRLGWSLNNQKKYPESEKVFRKGLKYHPDNAGIYNELGWNFYWQRRYDEAGKVFHDALVQHPDNVKILNGMGWTLLRQLKYDEAGANFLKGLAQDPKDRACINGLVTLKIETRDYNAASRYADKYMAVTPRNRKYGYLLLGRIKMLQKNYPVAEQHLKEAVAMDSSYVLANREIGYLFAIQKRFDQAMKFAKKAISLDSSFANQNLLAWVMVTGEIDVDGGIAIARNVIDSKPENWAHTATIYPYYAIPEHTLGLAYLKLGDYEKAIQYLEQAAELAPERESIQMDLQRAKKISDSAQMESTSEVDSI